MTTPPLGPYISLSLQGRLELLAFEVRFAGIPRSLIQALRGTIDRLQVKSICRVPSVRTLWGVPKLLLAWVTSNPRVAAGSP